MVWLQTPQFGASSAPAVCDSTSVASRISALQPKSLRVLDQNLEDIFLNAVAAGDGESVARATALEA